MNFGDFLDGLKGFADKKKNRKLYYINPQADGLLTDKAFIQEMLILREISEIREAKERNSWRVRGNKNLFGYLVDEFPQYFFGGKAMTEKEAAKHFPSLKEE